MMGKTGLKSEGQQSRSVGQKGMSLQPSPAKPVMPSLGLLERQAVDHRDVRPSQLFPTITIWPWASHFTLICQQVNNRAFSHEDMVRLR